MRTGRTLTVFRSLLFPGGGVWSQGGTCLVRGGVWSQGGTCLVRGGVRSRGCTCLVRGGGCLVRYPPCGQNDTRLWKYYLGQNFVSAGNENCFQKMEENALANNFFQKISLQCVNKVLLFQWIWITKFCNSNSYHLPRLGFRYWACSQWILLYLPPFCGC